MRRGDAELLEGGVPPPANRMEDSRPAMAELPVYVESIQLLAAGANTIPHLNRKLILLESDLRIIVWHGGALINGAPLDTWYRLCCTSLRIHAVGGAENAASTAASSASRIIGVQYGRRCRWPVLAKVRDPQSRLGVSARAAAPAAARAPTEWPIPATRRSSERPAKAAIGMILYGTQRPNPPAHRLGYWPAAECPMVLLTASAPEAGKPGRRASVRVSLTAT